MTLTPPMAATMQNVCGQLASSSRKTHIIDVKHFAQWLAGQELSLNSLDRDDLVSYRAHLFQAGKRRGYDTKWNKKYDIK